jgi:hypothetical protein
MQNCRHELARQSFAVLSCCRTSLTYVTNRHFKQFTFDPGSPPLKLIVVKARFQATLDQLAVSVHCVVEVSDCHGSSPSSLKRPWNEVPSSRWSLGQNDVERAHTPPSNTSSPAHLLSTPESCDLHCGPNYPSRSCQPQSAFRRR